MSDFSDQKALLFQAWQCVLAESSAVYLSGPITTGPRFLEWFVKSKSLEGADFQKELKAFVVEPNSRDIKDTATQLRAELNEPILEPASLYIPGWNQRQYLDLWSTVIDRFVKRLVVMSGWQYSVGCATELTHAFELGLPISTIDGELLTVEMACDLLEDALRGPAGQLLPDLKQSHSNLRQLRTIAPRKASAPGVTSLRKDESLDHLADTMNVAQFVSFSPARGRLRQEYSRVLDNSPNHLFNDVREALSTLLERSSEGTLNLRSFTPESPQSREFIYGIDNLDYAESVAKRLGGEGLYVIANETIDVHDGGVSGVAMGGITEFVPDDTPRGVEKPGVASLPSDWANRMLSAVYGITPDINFGRDVRVEFSIHPKPRGWRHAHTIGWELGPALGPDLTAKLAWPNLFSRLVGDKVFGLLIAHLAGLPVPYTTVMNRRIAPFSFGRQTGSLEKWLRTSPREQLPGKFTTRKGWADPFALMAHEDADGDQIVSVLSQAAVDAKYAGAAIVTADGHLLIEGKAGEGDVFMMGSSGPQRLPLDVELAVSSLYSRAHRVLGPVRFEWVFDGSSAWIVQLHRGATESSGTVVVPGEAKHWVSFDIENGLTELTKLVQSLRGKSGILLRGDVGLTSHIADVVRKGRIPTRIEKPAIRANAVHKA
ncbi:hypothetical protein NKJ55_32035 [Mesorhizobium sp. M0106]|uniref:hypothetical protein n=1 Tax=Mesorhizobium sp. M0106 TaxID=2956880 RepID=UPI003335A583